MNQLTLPIFDLRRAIGNVAGAAEVSRIRPPTRPVLRRETGPQQTEVFLVDVGGVCAHGCLFCPHENDFQSLLDSGIAERLHRELSARRDLPKTVLVNASVPPRSAVDDFHREIGAIVRVLHRFGVLARLSTRCSMGVPLLDTLHACRERVKVTVALTTLDRAIYRAIEPDASLPEDRLELISELLDRAIAVDVAINPMVPDLTDMPDRLRALLENLADVGVRRVTAGYLVLREGTRERLHAALDELGQSETVFGSYADGPLLRDGRGMAQFLGKSRRQRGYATLMTIAAGLGIETRVDGPANPDFRAAKPPDSPHHLRSLQQTFRRRCDFPRA